MAELTNMEFESVPAMRIIGRERSVSMADGVENPIPALWEESLRDGTIDLLIKLPLALENCTVGWMGDAKGDDFAYIVGVAAAENTPVPSGMQYRDLPACEIAKGTVYGNMQNGDVYGNAHNITVAGIEERGYKPDYSFGWSAEMYPGGWDFGGPEGAIIYLCPYKK